LDERRRARLEWRTPGGEKAFCDRIGVLNWPRRQRHGQLQRLRQQRSRGEMDRGADRAVVVCVTGGLSRRVGRSGLRAGDGATVDGVSEIAAVDVAEREDDLQRQREQRQP
jgi:hypothetical protein